MDRLWLHCHGMLVHLGKAAAAWTGHCASAKRCYLHHDPLPVVLGERIGIYRWSAVITGMTGIILLTNPLDGGFPNVVFGVAGALASAVLAILLRRLGKADHPFSVAVWYTGTGAIMLTLLRSRCRET